MFKKILLPVDLEHTDSARDSVTFAVEEARRSGASIHVMTVAPGFGMPLVASFFSDEQVKGAMKEIARHMSKFTEENIPADLLGTSLVTEGNPAEKILKHAEDIQCDLIVISSHDTELEKIFIGSVAAKVVRHSNCTVLVCK
jgi:nucleotide-binding universal stress UspA family protein